MARVTIRRYSFEYATLVTRGTIGRLMRSNQRKQRFLVIERRRLPHGHGMARRTIMRELRSFMIGDCCLVVDLLMAGKTIARQACEAVVRVARCTLDRLMSARQLKIGF